MDKDSAKQIFYKAISLLIAITFDPSKYNFQIEEGEKLHEDTCNSHYNKFEENFTRDLDIQIFNELKELIQNCPEKMYQIVNSWCIKTNIKLFVNQDEENKKEDIEITEIRDPRKLRLEVQLRLSATSFYLKYCKRSRKTYK